jgi:hypothetical protein
MRLLAHPARHARRRTLTPASYVITALAALAAVIAAFSFASQQNAQAQPGLIRALGAAADRGAADAITDDSAFLIAQGKITAARAAGTLARTRAAVAAAAVYTVRPGDSLSSVAAKRCGGQSRTWTGIYAASRARGWTAKNANVLTAGQHLWVSCFYRASLLRFAPLPRPVYRTAAAVSGPAASPVYHRAYASSSYHGSGSMQQCIISRESGGSSQVMNASGHYGLYQFSASTWAAHGGSPADFGNASVAEQNQVYYSTVASDGYSDWAPYDGC